MDEELRKVIMFMKQIYGRDISMYDQSFLLKSLKKRWDTIGVNNVKEYFNCLANDDKEVEAFYSSLHITFSQFFRDSLTFALLERSILPNIFSYKPEGSEIRIWSAGCSDGPEAYSIAMLLSDLAEVSGKELRFRIFATDISEEALIAGRTGVYDQSVIQNVKAKHLDKYFIRQGKTYTIIPRLRSYINFSIYDLLDLSTLNPPESIYGDFDIVVCSNVLIYYKSDAQKIIIKKLQQATASNGYLVTGESEKMLVERNATHLQMIMTPTAIFEK